MNRCRATFQRFRTLFGSNDASCYGFRRGIYRFFGFLFLASVVAVSGCSVPNLETSQCTAARDSVKRFYSFHFGTEMSTSPDNLKARDTFLTKDLVSLLAANGDLRRDYFTATENYPRAFRVGECRSASDEKATLQVLLLWRDDSSSDQKEVQVETVKDGDKWLINRVLN